MTERITLQWYYNSVYSVFMYVCVYILLFYIIKILKTYLNNCIIP